MAAIEPTQALISSLEGELKSATSVLGILGDSPETEKARLPLLARKELLESILPKIREAMLPSTCTEWISFNNGSQIVCEKPHGHPGQHCKKMHAQSGANETFLAEVTWIRSPIVKVVP